MSKIFVTSIKTAAAVALLGLAMAGAVSPVLAGTTARDHRGPNGAPEGGVTVNGSKATIGVRCLKCKGGVTTTDDGQDGGPTVRDHRRGPKPKDPSQ